MAGKSKRQQKIDRLTAPVGVDQPAIDRLAPEERGNVYDPSGLVTPIKKRACVFNILRDSGSLSRNQAASAMRLQSIYATLAQVGEAPEPDDMEDFATREVLHITHQSILRAKGALQAEAQYRKTCQKIGPFSAALLTVLFHDHLKCDHEAPVTNSNGKVIPRWRLKVRQFCASRGRVIATNNEECLVVWMACEELQRVL